MLIHLIRHTTPNIESGVCYGQTDLDLADSFPQEKAAILAKLKAGYDAVYTSPLKRCASLSRTIEAETRVTDDRLKEYNFGEWEMRPWADFKSEADQLWMREFVDQAAPQGDSIISMQKRVMAFWHELLEQPYESVAVVTHSGVQRLIHAHILATPLDRLFRLGLDFGAVLEVHWSAEHKFATIKHL